MFVVEMILFLQDVIMSQKQQQSNINISKQRDSKMQRQQILKQQNTSDSQLNKIQSQQGSDSQIFYTIASDHDLLLNQQQLQNFNKISQQTQKTSNPTNFRKTQINQNLSIVNTFHSRRKSQTINYNPENKRGGVGGYGGFTGLSDQKRMEEKSSTVIYRIKVINSREELINQEVFYVKGNWSLNNVKQEGKILEEVDKKVNKKINQEIDYKIDEKINNNNNENFDKLQKIDDDNDEDTYIISCPYQLKLFSDRGPNIITKDQIRNNQQIAALEKSRKIVVEAIRKIIPITDEKSQQRQRVREKSRLQLLEKRQIQDKKMEKEIQTQKRLREDLKRFGVEVEEIDEIYSDQSSHTMNQQAKQFSSEPELAQKQSTKIPQIRTINKLQILIGSCYYLSKLKLTNTSIQSRYSKFTSQNQFQKIKYQLTSHNLLINRSALSIPIISITKIKLMPVTLTKQQRSEIICRAKYLIQLKITFGYAEEINSKVIEREEIVFLIESYEVIFSIFSSIIVRKLLLADSVGKLPNGETNQVCHTIRMILSQYNLAVTCFMDKSKFIQFCGAKRVNRDIEYKCPEFKGVVYRKGRMLKKWETRYIEISDFKIKVFKDPALIAIKIKEQIIKRGFMRQELREKKLELLKKQVEFNSSKNKKKQPQPQIIINRIQELWTRFDFYHSSINQLNDQPLTQIYLVVKVHYYKVLQKIKVEFAIPIINYADIYHTFNWLYGIGAVLAVTNYKQ